MVQLQLIVYPHYFRRIYNEILVRSVLYFIYEFVYKNLDRGLIKKMDPLCVIEVCLNIHNLPVFL